MAASPPAFPVLWEHAVAFTGEDDSEAGSGPVGRRTRRVTLASDDAMALAVTPVSAATITSVVSAAVTGQLLAANSARKGLIIVNTDANDLYVKYGATATVSAGGYTVIIPSGGYWEMPNPIYTGRVDGIWAADGSGVAEITEF